MSDEAKHDVGYGRPPAASRFKPGQSGNPAGRPKRAPSFTLELMEELAVETTVEGGREKITRQRAIAKSLVNEAINGNVRVLSLLLPMLARLPENDDAGSSGEASDREIVEDYLSRELRRRARDGRGE